MKTVKAKLFELGFSGRGYDGIDMTQDELETELGIKLDDHQSKSNQYGGCDYTIDDDTGDDITIEILDGKVHDVYID
jgi:hypothetical protein